MRRSFHVLVICLLGISEVSLAAPAVPDEAGVRAAEASWSRAFMAGDGATLDALLAPDYVSVAANGSVRPKAEILRVSAAYAKAHPGATPGTPSSTSAVHLIGNTALVRHASPTETSVDVLYFQDGGWHAWYSQHTKIETKS
jgi:ketosteroid isomerase-like protein